MYYGTTLWEFTWCCKSTKICNLGTMVVRVRVRVHKFDAYNTHTGPLVANGEAVAEASKAT